jgi:hypothetical protein
LFCIYKSNVEIFKCYVIKIIKLQNLNFLIFSTIVPQKIVHALFNIDELNASFYYKHIAKKLIFPILSKQVIVLFLFTSNIFISVTTS